MGLLERKAEKGIERKFSWDKPIKFEAFCIALASLGNPNDRLKEGGLLCLFLPFSFKFFRFTAEFNISPENNEIFRFYAI